MSFDNVSITILWTSDEVTICRSWKDVTMHFSIQLNCSDPSKTPSSTFEDSLSFSRSLWKLLQHNLLAFLVLLLSCSALTDISSPFHDQITMSHTLRFEYEKNKSCSTTNKPPTSASAQARCSIQNNTDLIWSPPTPLYQLQSAAPKPLQERQ